jgi:DNA-directed RNA polymerase specialized sigma24 family protein
VTAPGQGAGQDIFREVLKQQELIRAVLHRYGVPDAHVDDLVQDALVVAHRRITEGAFCPPEGKPLSGAVAAWLIGISRNLARDLRRSLAVHDGLFVNEECYRVDFDVLMVPSPEERLLGQEELEVLTRLKLSAAQREIVTLSGMGHTAVEIGATLGLLPATVATHRRWFGLDRRGFGRIRHDRLSPDRSDRCR